MPELQIPPIVGPPRQAEQAQANQQLLQLAQMKLLMDRQQEANEDRDFRGLMTIAGDVNFPDDMRLAAINRIAPKLGLQGEVTLEGLRPMTGLLTKMWETRTKGGDLTIYQPAVEMITANPRLIAPSQIPQAIELQQELRSQRAASAVELVNPIAPEVQQAMERVKTREPDLIEMRRNGERWEAMVDGPQYSPTVRRESLANLERLHALDGEDVRDQAMIQGDVLRQERNQKIKKVIQNNPEALAKVEQFGLASAGFSPFDAEGRKMRLHLLQTKESLTPDETRELDSLSRLELGKSVMGQINQTNAAMLELRMRQAKAEAGDLAKAKETDSTALTAAEPYRVQLDTIIEQGKQANTPEAVTKVGTLAQQASEAIGTEKLAHVQTVTPQVQLLTEDRAALEQKATELHRAAAGASSVQRATMLDQERSLRRLLEARDAQLNLLTIYHPLEGMEHEWQKRLHEANVELLETSLTTKEHPPEVREKLETELKTSRGIVATETKALEDWTKGRQQALVSVEKARLGLERDAAALQTKMSSVQMQLEKEEATNLLATALVRDMADGKTLTQALRGNAGLFPRAETKDAIKIAQDVTKEDRTTATIYAQDIFVGLLEQQKGDLTPQVTAGLARKSVAAAEKKTGLKVSPDDVMKALPTSKSIEVKLISPGERKDIAESRAQQLELQNIKRLYQSKFVGKLDDLVAKFKGPLDLLTPDEAEFRAAVKKFRSGLLKFYAGTAQTKSEMKNLVEAIPDTGMSDSQFEASIKATEENVARLAGQTAAVAEEVGMRAPSPFPPLSPKKQALFDQLRQANPGQEAQIRQFIMALPED